MSSHHNAVYHTGIAHDGWSSEDEATATCFCGKVQLAVPLKAPGLATVFLCNCTDCRKVTATMFATNFTTLQSHTRWLRGREDITEWGQDETPKSGKTMTNGFCKTCGTLMYRRGDAFPGTYFLRVGTVDDQALHETVLKPRIECFVENRVGWFSGVPGAIHVEGPMKGDEEENADTQAE